MTTVALLVGIASNVVLVFYVYAACKRSGENHKRWLDAERASRVKGDLMLMHEKRAEMYRAFLIEREATGRASKLSRSELDSFGGAR